MLNFKEKQELYENFLPDFSKILIACPSIRHRQEMTISAFDEFPHRAIYGEAKEKELYADYIEKGWQWIEQENPQNIGKIRNQILRDFKDSDYEYLLIIDDEVEWRKVIFSEDSGFSTKISNDIFNEWCSEFVRMDKEHIDVLTVPNSQFLTARVTDTVMEDKPGIDYSFIAFNRNILKNNYWYETAPETCEDQFMAKLLLADPNLKARYSIVLRRDTQQNGEGTSTYGDTDGHKAWQDRTNDILEQLSAKGFTADLMNLLWSPEHRPTERYPLGYKRHKKYIQENLNKSKWNRFISVK